MSLTNEQIEARRKTIGGSDIGAILGENPYKTAYEVWEEKVEGKTVDLSRNKSVVVGNLLETALIDKYERFAGKICRQSCTIFHKDYSYLSANLDSISMESGDNWVPDYLFERENVVEIKTASTFNKDDWGQSWTELVPKQYYAQIAHYMLVSGLSSADIFVGFVDESVIGDVLCEMNLSITEGRPAEYWQVVKEMETRLYRFERDEEIENLMLESAISFYENHMRPWIEHGTKNPPPMDFSNKGFQNCLRKKYSIQEDSVIKLPPEFVKIKDKYLDFMLQSKEFDKLAQDEKSKILAAMENNQKATLDDGSYFLRKTVSRKESVVKASEYTKFEFKQAKGDI